MHNNTCIRNDLVDVPPLSQPAVTQYLKELKQIGMIKDEAEGLDVNYLYSFSPINAEDGSRKSQ